MDTRTQRTERVSGKKYHIGMEEVALFVVLVLSILGIGITNFRPLESYRYWGTMTIVLAITGLVIGWARSKRSGKPVRKMLVIQLVHWGATLAAVAGMFLLLKMGRLNYENTGLVILLTLGFSTFLDGYRISWSFAAIGAMMFIAGLLGGYLEQYVWITLIILICIFVIVYLFEKYKRFSSASSTKEADAAPSSKNEGPKQSGRSI